LLLSLIFSGSFVQCPIWTSVSSHRFRELITCFIASTAAANNL
jgi:hypothetical protein